METDRTLAEARFQVEGTPRNNLILCDLGGHPPRRTDEDDLSLGASASPTANATEKKWFDRSNNYEPTTTEYSYASALIKHDTGKNQIQLYVCVEMYRFARYYFPV